MNPAASETRSTNHLLGCKKSELDTPALCLDLDKFEANVQRIAADCRANKVQWRPHAKCHKSPELARRLVEAGACGVTCATIREAEVMAEGGIRDLLIANMIAGPVKAARVARLASTCDLMICVDHPAQVDAVSAAVTHANASVRVLVELEIGMNRVGVATSQLALELARRIQRLPGLDFAGVMAYEGHLLTIPKRHEKQAAIQAALERAISVKAMIERDGLACPIVSCGGTGSYPITLQQTGITEIQAGGAIFMDAFYREQCQITELDFALTLLATVVSNPSSDRIIIDAGKKAMNVELHAPQVVGHPGVTVDWLSAEHGALRVEREALLPEVGSTLELIPGYADLTNVLHPYFYGFRGNRLAEMIPIVRT